LAACRAVICATAPEVLSSRIRRGWDGRRRWRWSTSGSESRSGWGLPNDSHTTKKAVTGPLAGVPIKASATDVIRCACVCQRYGVNIMTPRPPTIVYAGLDESGSLTAAGPFFSMAVVVTPDPLSLRHLIRRAASRSGKRLGRPLKNAAKIKWSNASQRIRALALAELAETDAELFALTVLKGGRRIEDTPQMAVAGVTICGSRGQSA